MMSGLRSTLGKEESSKGVAELYLVSSLNHVSAQHTLPVKSVSPISRSSQVVVPQVRS